MLKQVFVLALAAGTVLSGQAKQELPASLLLEASRPPYEFAMYLADMSVPSGLEIRRADSSYFRQLKFDLDRKNTVPAAQVVEAFNTSHSDYRAVLMDNTFVIRPVTGRIRFLDEMSTLGRVDVTGMLNALDKVFAQLVPTLGRSTARLGSYLGGAPPDLGDEIVVSLDGSGRTVIDVLNHLVQQAPRTWVVETTNDAEKAQILRIGFLLKQSLGSFHSISQQK